MVSSEVSYLRFENVIFIFKLCFILVELLVGIDILLFSFQSPRGGCQSGQKNRALSSSKKRKIDFGGAPRSSEGGKEDWETLLCT